MSVLTSKEHGAESTPVRFAVRPMPGMPEIDRLQVPVSPAGLRTSRPEGSRSGRDIHTCYLTGTNVPPETVAFVNCFRASPFSSKEVTPVMPG